MLSDTGWVIAGLACLVLLPLLGTRLLRGQAGDPVIRRSNALGKRRGRASRRVSRGAARYTGSNHGL